MQAKKDQNLYARMGLPGPKAETDTANSDIDLMLISNEISYGALFSALEDASTRPKSVHSPLDSANTWHFIVKMYC